MKHYSTALILTLSLCLLSCSKSDDGITYTFKQGSNNAKPLHPIVLHFGNTLTFSFKLGKEWDDGLICTDKAHGLKLPAIGGTFIPPDWDYHDSGINFGVM